MSEPSLTVHEEDLVVLYVEGGGVVVAGPMWEELRDPWWVRLFRWVVGYRAPRAFVKRPTRG